MRHQSSQLLQVSCVMEGYERKSLPRLDNDFHVLNVFASCRLLEVDVKRKFTITNEEIQSLLPKRSNQDRFIELASSMKKF